MTHISRHVIEVIYQKIQINEPVTQITIRRQTPEYCSSTIRKCIGILQQEGRVKKDKDWPPRYSTTRYTKRVG